MHEEDIGYRLGTGGYAELGYGTTGRVGRLPLLVAGLNLTLVMRLGGRHSESATAVGPFGSPCELFLARSMSLRDGRWRSLGAHIERLPAATEAVRSVCCGVTFTPLNRASSNRG